MNELVVVEDVWTKFWDMHSGGDTKEPPWNRIYIQAPEEQAIRIFYARFGHNPHRVSCTCCGADYSIDSGPFRELSAYDRNCGHDDNGYIEERDRSMDRYALDYFRRSVRTPKQRKLLAMAEDKGSPNEAEIAMALLYASTGYGTWSPYLTVDEFSAGGVAKHGEKTLFIEAHEITKEEWALTEDPEEEGYVWR